MRIRDVLLGSWISFCGASLLVGCLSSDRGRETDDAARSPDATTTPDHPSADTLALDDVPLDLLGQDSADAPSSADAPTRGDAANSVDASNSGDGSGRPDGHYFTIPDGRQFLQVDYCLPILPLSQGSLRCPATLDDARAALLSAFDGGVLDARSMMDGRPEILEPCVEPLDVYLPHGRSLGWGESCYYDTKSGQLLSIVVGSDTPAECMSSPVPNTAAFTAYVYGQLVTCTWPGPSGG